MTNAVITLRETRGMPVHAALRYSDAKGSRVFPCQWDGPDRKKPLIKHWDEKATTDREVVEEWWTRWPDALVAIPTGKCSGFVVLDIDNKRDGANGFETLKELGFATRPDTRRLWTPNNGMHLHCDPCTHYIRNTAGEHGRGIGKLSYMGHALMENRHGLAVTGRVTQANGTAERRTSEEMLAKQAQRSTGRISAGEDKAYDTQDHVAALRNLGVTHHVTQNDGETKTGRNRRSAIDGRTTRHTGYAISQSRRAMMIECVFG